MNKKEIIQEILGKTFVMYKEVLRMKRKEIAIMICLLGVVSFLLGGCKSDVFIGLLAPLAGPAINVMVAGNYAETMDISFEYFGKENFDMGEVHIAEWTRVLCADIDEKQWAFIVDSEEEYQNQYVAYGVTSDLVEDFDFENNILIISLNRPLSSVRIWERYTVWEDGQPYASPEFTFQYANETNAVYFQSIPRVDLKYKNADGEVIVAKLSLWETEYGDRENPEHGKEQGQHVDFWGFIKKWTWAFKYFNRS